MLKPQLSMVDRSTRCLQHAPREDTITQCWTTSRRNKLISCLYCYTSVCIFISAKWTEWTGYTVFTFVFLSVCVCLCALSPVFNSVCPSHNTSAISLMQLMSLPQPISLPHLADICTLWAHSSCIVCIVVFVRLLILYVHINLWIWYSWPALMAFAFLATFHSFSYSVHYVYALYCGE